jgi:hypothetical protein
MVAGRRRRPSASRDGVRPVTSVAMPTAPARAAWPAWIQHTGPTLIIVAAGLFLWAPTLLIDTGRGDSLDFNLVWLNQFSRLVAHGHLYPRWLPASFGGLGSPAFEFYPPLPFWTTAVVSSVSGAWASPLLQLKLAALIALIGSGVSMRLWLTRLCAPQRALVCALIYMAAPYHLVDHYVRGAFAEFFAIAIIPLVALGLLETARGKRTGPLILATGYGLLVFSHLPVALLASVLLVAPYGLYLLWNARGERLRFALKGGAALACGAGLAAIYLIPALTLQGHISSEYLWSLLPSRHVFTSPIAWADPFQPILAAIAGIEATFAGLLGWRIWQGGDRRQLYWAALTLGVFVVLSGLIPGFWSIPLMAKVQFPWRAISIEEFTLVTLLALTPWPTPKGLAVLFGVLAIANPGMTADLRNLARGQPDAERVEPGHVEALLRTSTDAAEYLPHGMLRIEGVQPEPLVPLQTLTALPLAAPSLAATSDPMTGAIRLRPAAGARLVVLRRFYFPSWRVTCDGAPVTASPTGPGRLVGFAPPLRAKTCEAVVGQTLQERLGAALTLTSALAMLGYGLWALASAPRRRRRSPELAATEPATIAP